MEKLEILKQWVNESHRIVFLGGAGVSTESGIPDFRGVDGVVFKIRPLHAADAVFGLGGSTQIPCQL